MSVTLAARPRLSRRRWLWWGGIAATILIVSAAVGTVVGASAQFGAGATEKGQGAYVSESNPAYWVWQSTLLGTIPTPLPGLISLRAAAPTLLPVASTNYRIDAATVGNTSVVWQFQEATTAPHSTELELRFTAGLSGTAVKITGYVETRAVAILAALTFTFAWDAGAFAPGVVTVESMQVSVLVCTAIGTCP